LAGWFWIDRYKSPKQNCAVRTGDWEAGTVNITAQPAMQKRSCLTASILAVPAKDGGGMSASYEA